MLYNEQEQNKIYLGKQLCDSQMLKLRKDTKLISGQEKITVSYDVLFFFF